MSQVSKFLSLVLRHQPQRIGITLDDAGWTDVGALLIESITPQALEVALEVQAEVVARAAEADALRELAVERARYEADLAQRRFLRVDPDNRLVADVLEAEWNAKHRRYARQEAEEILRHTDRFGALLQRALFGAGLERRRAVKQLSYALPARPLLRFIYQYLLRGGFLDGPGAFRYCRLLARYEGFATAELKRLRAERHG